MKQKIFEQKMLLPSTFPELSDLPKNSIFQHVLTGDDKSVRSYLARPNASVNIQTTTQKIPLIYYAALGQRLTTMRLLVEAKANIAPPHTFSLLQIALTGKNTEIIKYVLELYGRLDLPIEQIKQIYQVLAKLTSQVVRSADMETLDYLCEYLPFHCLVMTTKNLYEFTIDYFSLNSTNQKPLTSDQRMEVKQIQAARKKLMAAIKIWLDNYSKHPTALKAQLLSQALSFALESEHQKQDKELIKDHLLPATKLARKVHLMWAVKTSRPKVLACQLDEMKAQEEQLDRWWFSDTGVFSADGLLASNEDEKELLREGRKKPRIYTTINFLLEEAVRANHFSESNSQVATLLMDRFPEEINDLPPEVKGESLSHLKRITNLDLLDHLEILLGSYQSRLNSRLNPAIVTGFTPLMAAASQGKTVLVQKLLERKAEPNAFTGLGATALLIAVYNNHVEIAELLLQHGANPQCSLVNGVNAFTLSETRSKKMRAFMLEVLKKTQHPGQSEEKSDSKSDALAQKIGGMVSGTVCSEETISARKKDEIKYIKPELDTLRRLLVLCIDALSLPELIILRAAYLATFAQMMRKIVSLENEMGLHSLFPTELARRISNIIFHCHDINLSGVHDFDQKCDLSKIRVDDCTYDLSNIHDPKKNRESTGSVINMVQKVCDFIESPCVAEDATDALKQIQSSSLNMLYQHSQHISSERRIKVRMSQLYIINVELFYLKQTFSLLPFMVVEKAWQYILARFNIYLKDRRVVARSKKTLDSSVIQAAQVQGASFRHPELSEEVKESYAAAHNFSSLYVFHFFRCRTFTEPTCYLINDYANLYATDANASLVVSK